MVGYRSITFPFILVCRLGFLTGSGQGLNATHGDVVFLNPPHVQKYLPLKMIVLQNEGESNSTEMS